jgi:hypothetical protein
LARIGIDRWFPPVESPANFNVEQAGKGRSCINLIWSKFAEGERAQAFGPALEESDE